MLQRKTTRQSAFRAKSGLDRFCGKHKKSYYRGIAQFGSALDWGSRGHGFKSRYSDQETMRVQNALAFLYAGIAFAECNNGYACI